MRRVNAIISIVVGSVAVAAQTMYPVPKGASEIGHVAIQPGVYEQDHFFLIEQFPGASAAEHYAAVFSKWRPCYGTGREWDSFPDVRGEEPQFIHELVRHWVSPRNDVAVTLALRYTSPGLATRAVPANDKQFVVVLRLETKDAERHLTEIDAKCEKGP